MPTRNSVCRAIITATAMLFLTLASARADDPQTLKDRLHAAEKDTSLTGDDVQPFYLKMSVQLYDSKGAPSEQGTVEVFWANRHRQKLIYSFPSFSRTEVRIDDNMFSMPSAAAPPEMVRTLLDQVLHPMPSAEAIDKSQPVMQKITLGKVPLDCIMLAGPLGIRPGVVYGPLANTPAPMGLFPTYCLGSDETIFRVAMRYGGQITLRNSIAAFQGHHVAQDILVNAQNRPLAEGKIASLEQRAISDSEFATEGLTLLGHGLSFQGTDTPVRVSSGVINGLALSKPDPLYPAAARERHAQGVVVLQALIGTDGHIQDLRVLSSPDPDLAVAAIDAVRQWTYRPYLLNGFAVSVETTIQVNFTFGGR